MSDKSQSWFYPKLTGDPGRDRNARTLQFSCLAFSAALGAVAVVDAIFGEQVPFPILVSVVGLLAAAGLNRARRPAWAGRAVILTMMLGAILLVFEARDGFRSHAMLVFPGLLLLSVMLLDRTSYLTTAVIILLAVAALGIAEKQGVTGAIPGVRTSTSYASIFYVDLTLAIFAMIGSRIANDLQSDVFDLRASIGQLSVANLESTKTAEALRESEERFRLATKATNDAIWDMDLKTGAVSWNDTYSALYGRPSEASDSWQWWSDNMHADDRDRTVSYLRAAIASGASSWSGEYRFRRVDGQWAHIYDRAFIACDASGTASRVIGAMQDLTERKQAEAALRESEERFRRVFEEGPLGLALVGRDYHFLKTNNALCQIVGFTEEELAQKTFADITHPEDVRADVELAERLFRGDIPYYRMQKRYLKKNGEIIWVNLTGSLIRSNDGQPLYALGMVEDITEVKRTQDESLARQKLESVGTLANGIAHDFNNILGAVLAQAEVAKAELDVGSSCKNELKTIREVALRGSEIVRQLMIYAGKESEVVGLVNVSEIAEEMLPLLKVSLSKHAAITSNLEPALPPIRAGAAQLRQILMNLVTNASDAIGDRDGVIRVTTRVVRLGEVSAAASEALPEHDYQVLEVSDTGCGMSPETQGRVFDPFFTTKSAGRGLGLAVVSGIVRGLGGAIHLTSEPGKGTTFQILLPSTETADVTATIDTPPAIESFAAPPDAAVLIVEDENVLREAVAKMLRRTGFEVLEAADGSSAIDLLRANPGRVDVVLLDMTIPGASSHEVIVEAAKVKPDVRVILTSAYSREMLPGATSAPQIRSFIRKPFQLADLMETLRHSLVSEGTNREHHY